MELTEAQTSSQIAKIVKLMPKPCTSV